MGITGDDAEFTIASDSGTSTTKTITTTAAVANVSGTNLSERRSIELQPLDGKIYWGYDSSCPFLLFNKQSRVIACGENLDVYYKSFAGSVDVAVGEK